MKIKIYNTLSAKIEEFKPISPSEVGMYNCGPTVYDYAHIGNLRSYVFADILRRTLEYAGYKVKQIVNITDVGHLTSNEDTGDDRMTKALRRESLPISLENMRKIGDKYTTAFISDLQKLNIEQADNYPKASDHIEDDIQFIEQLEKKGFVYKTNDGIYFDTSKFPSYGKLGSIDIASQKAGARVDINTEKRNPRDFAVWKNDKELGWESPWGRGFPGWHIECSVMSHKYLGQPFDIHTGGIDHISIHHNNEIAQSEAVYDVPLANYWMHNAFLTVNNGEKMAKSEANFITLNTLKEHFISPLSYRYLLLTAHYRSPINFSFEALAAAQNALIRLLSIVSDIPSDGKVISSYKEKFDQYICNDLDTPKALALCWELLKDSHEKDEDKKATLLLFDKVLGFNLSSLKGIVQQEIPEEIKVLGELREQSRKEKDWKKADALRKEIETRGFLIQDDNDGYKIVRKL